MKGCNGGSDVVAGTPDPARLNLVDGLLGDVDALVFQTLNKLRFGKPLFQYVFYEVCNHARKFTPKGVLCQIIFYKIYFFFLLTDTLEGV